MSDEGWDGNSALYAIVPVLDGVLHYPPKYEGMEDLLLPKNVKSLSEFSGQLWFLNYLNGKKIEVMQKIGYTFFGHNLV